MGGAMAELEKTLRRSAKKAGCAIYTRKSWEEGLEQAFALIGHEVFPAARMWGERW